ncbi:unnamed protein product [Meloidogyne enterolobii]|uniref:Uncharacterized protein n=1 Tax=Meloidogyne enterolobii TaxID=390850 RepID=A0ACB1A569_MELEN
MQRYQPENFLTLNSKKSSTNKNTFNNLITMKATIIGLFFLCQFIVNSAAPIPRSRYNNYPAVDLSDLEWPEAQPIQLLNENGVVSVVECYTELDASFINSNLIYRLNNTAEVRDRSCVVRLPTHMILTIIDIKTHDDNSYVTVMAGSSKIIMPLSINHIRSGEFLFDNYFKLSMLLEFKNIYKKLKHVLKNLNLLLKALKLLQKI